VRRERLQAGQRQQSRLPTLDHKPKSLNLKQQGMLPQALLSVSGRDRSLGEAVSGHSSQECLCCLCPAGATPKSGAGNLSTTLERASAPPIRSRITRISNPLPLPCAKSRGEMVAKVPTPFSKVLRGSATPRCPHSVFGARIIIMRQCDLILLLHVMCVSTWRGVYRAFASLSSPTLTSLHTLPPLSHRFPPRSRHDFSSRREPPLFPPACLPSHAPSLLRLVARG